MGVVNARIKKQSLHSLSRRAYQGCITPPYRITCKPLSSEIHRGYNQFPAPVAAEGILDSLLIVALGTPIVSFQRLILQTKKARDSAS